MASSTLPQPILFLTAETRPPPEELGQTLTKQEARTNAVKGPAHPDQLLRPAWQRRHARPRSAPQARWVTDAAEQPVGAVTYLADADRAADQIGG
jgi:hypothetical protein